MHIRTFINLTLLFLSLSKAGESGMAPIWKISDGDSTVFLSGSVHLLREQDMPVPPAFDRVYDEAEELVFEIDMAIMSDPSTGAKIRRLGLLPEGQRLSEKLSPATMDRLRDYLAMSKMGRSDFDRFTPGMVYMMLGSLEATRHGARPELGLETLYYLKCVEDGKPSRGLETVEYQMSRFSNLGDEVLEKLINEALDEVQAGAEALNSLISAWRSGDAKELGELIVEQTDSDPGIREVLLIERNRNWIPEIEKHLASDRDVMFLVGAAHLVGEDSVLDLLEEKGYEVLQLANSE